LGDVGRAMRTVNLPSFLPSLSSVAKGLGRVGDFVPPHFNIRTASRDPSRTSQTLQMGRLRCIVQALSKKCRSSDEGLRSTVRISRCRQSCRTNGEIDVPQNNCRGPGGFRLRCNRRPGPPPARRLPIRSSWHRPGFSWSFRRHWLLRFRESI
jgi:hypothetical protein